MSLIPQFDEQLAREQNLLAFCGFFASTYGTMRYCAHRLYWRHNRRLRGGCIRSRLSQRLVADNVLPYQNSKQESRRRACHTIDIRDRDDAKDWRTSEPNRAMPRVSTPQSRLRKCHPKSDAIEPVRSNKSQRHGDAQGGNHSQPLSRNSNRQPRRQSDRRPMPVDWHRHQRRPAIAGLSPHPLMLRDCRHNETV